MLRIYNTLTRTKEEFEPLHPPRVTFYNCGPTVYGHFHIGNARNFVLADGIRRYLRFRGYEVRFVQNITDIDDKVIRRANEEGRSPQEIADTFTRAYFQNLAALGIEPPDVSPRATEHIPQMIAALQALIDKGYAYVVEGNVYFRVGRFDRYGELSDRKIEDLVEGKRVEVDPRKEDPKDFDLWKAAKPGEPTWDTPWGAGRPGWHIECSVMAITHLGETIDIHSGGSDLIFPHHENEIAQAEAVTGKPFVRYWIHNAFLNIGGEKMSKSLGNIVNIDEVLARHDPMVVRYFFLSAHYRRPVDYGPDSLEEARKALGRLVSSLDTIEKVLALTALPKETDAAPTAAEDRQALEAIRERFSECMDDDFNTPRALSVLFDAISDLHEKRRSFEDPGKGAQARAYARAAIARIRELGQVLGLDFASKGAADLPVEQLFAWPAKMYEDLVQIGAKDLAESMAKQMENLRLAIESTVTSLAPTAADLREAQEQTTEALAPSDSRLRAAMAQMGQMTRVHAPSAFELRAGTVAMENLTEALTPSASKREAARAAIEQLAKAGGPPSPAQLQAALAKTMAAARREQPGPDTAAEKIRTAFALGLIEVAAQVRNRARWVKRFEVADRIRDSLAQIGIGLEDYRSGTIWKRE